MSRSARSRRQTESGLNAMSLSIQNRCVNCGSERNLRTITLRPRGIRLSECMMQRAAQPQMHRVAGHARRCWRRSSSSPPRCSTAWRTSRSWISATRSGSIGYFGACLSPRGAGGLAFGGGGGCLLLACGCFASGGGLGAAGALCPTDTEMPNSRHCPSTGAYISSKFTWLRHRGKESRHAHQAVGLDLRQQRELRIDHRHAGEIELVAALLGEDLAQAAPPLLPAESRAQPMIAQHRVVAGLVGLVERKQRRTHQHEHAVAVDTVRASGPLRPFGSACAAAGHDDKRRDGCKPARLRAERRYGRYAALVTKRR